MTVGWPPAAMATADQHATGPAPGRLSLIRNLNDRLRQTGRGGRVMVTARIAALPEAERAAIISAARGFHAFDADNDPHDEHDFGAVEVGTVRALWKIDCYDRDPRFASPAPADPAVTLRVLTIMLAAEY